MQYYVHFVVFDALIKLFVIPLDGNNFQGKKKKKLNEFLTGIINSLLVLEFV